MSPLGLLDLWHFLFLFTYVSPRIIRPVAFLISIYIYLLWDYKTCGGLVIPGEIYVNRNKKCHRSSNPRGDICK
jgi:hypothetical protein